MLDCIEKICQGEKLIKVDQRASSTDLKYIFLSLTLQEKLSGNVSIVNIDPLYLKCRCPSAVIWKQVNYNLSLWHIFYVGYSYYSIL